MDSTVTAALLQEEGYEVRGIFMSLAQPNILRQVARVRAVAAKIGVKVDVVDLHEEFSAKVLDYFRASYCAGLTPNPCVICNRHVKFGLLLQHALASGNELLATGHYVRVDAGDDGTYHLRKGLDPTKDQSYFLCLLDQEQLSRVRFPLGKRRKDEVYASAGKLGLEFTRSEESQDVCFLQETNVGDFIEAGEVVAVPGKVVTVDGKEVGEHSGIHRFTVGQRRGLGIPDATPYYVVALDVKTNQVVVGRKADLFSGQVKVSQMNWISGTAPDLPAGYEVRIRYRHQAVPAEIIPDGPNMVIHFNEPQRAVTPGQFAVLYDGDEVVGGGVIRRLDE